MRLPVLASPVIVALLASGGAFGQAGLPVEKLRDLYLQRLDAWVAAGGDLAKIQADVVGNCGRMMYLRDPSLGTATTKDLKEALDFRIDVCTKMTIHRVHSQPEFSNPATVKITCGDMPREEPVFERLCRAAKLTP